MNKENLHIKYFSLFSGIGGFELGITQAYEDLQNLLPPSESKHEAENSASLESGGVEFKSSARLGHPICIGYAEIDRYATQIYQKHFPEHKNYGDITKIEASELPDFDLLVGGFPCQAFSIAGKRMGFSDTRGTLFFDIARILREKQPRNFVLENVKGLLSHAGGDTFLTIISTLDELGYDLQWQVLNSKNFGVPQNRERVFIVGHLRGTSRPEVFPITEGNSKNLEQIIGGGQGNRVYGTGGVSTTIASQAGGQGAKTGLYEITGTLDANYYKGDNRPDNKSNRPRVIDGVGIRRLTPTECERLQGFPDGWTKFGIKTQERDGKEYYKKETEISDTQRYKTLGNAVSVPVIKAIIERIYG